MLFHKNILHLTWRSAKKTTKPLCNCSSESFWKETSLYPRTRYVERVKVELYIGELLKLFNSVFGVGFTASDELGYYFVLALEDHTGKVGRSCRDLNGNAHKTASGGAILRDHFVDEGRFEI